MLKWTASAFAMAAAMQFGLASAQEPEAGATISPPGPAVSDDAADNAQDAAEDARDAQQEAAQDTRENLQDARDDAQDAREDAADDANDGVQRQANFAPNASDANDAQLSDHVRAATANLNIDDATRSRYRWHNGEWWFKTKSGNWKFFRDGKWQDFDPTTYRAMSSGSGNFVPQGDTSYVQPQQMSGSSGYYYQARPYSVQRYSGYRGMYNNGWNNSGWNNRYYNNGYNNGWNNGYYNGGMGYNPRNDRYYGYGAYGQPYSISGDRYRGGVIGSQIGGQLGGNTGAIIGGAIGANAAD